MNSSAKKIEMISLDNLLGVDTENPKREAEIVRMPLDQMQPFHDHPFRVLDDARMAETVESVKRHGVLVPGIVRPYQGGYEIVSGHRRHRASELAGLPDMPVIIMELSDAEATVLMVDANIQREDILPSEKAHAYRMQYEALKLLGAGSGRNDARLAEQAGESRATIQRYIRLTYLDPQLLQLVDDGKLPKATAETLSYLSKKEQVMLLDNGTIPSAAQAQQLKAYSVKKELTAAVMELVLQRKEDEAKVSLKTQKIREFFPETYTGKQIEEIIYKLLGEWKSGAGNML